jgi:hypothetical protein
MVRPVDRNTVLWTLVVFFGASIMFAALREATRDESAAVTLVVQIAAGLIVVGGIVLFMRRRR